MYRILVVEDEDDIQKILKNYLIDQGYTVTLAYDGVDGIAKFHNGEAAVYFKDKGFHRIVLSREMTLEEIKYISKDLGIETEMFVHGAICVAYSGQCLMSSMIGGRSGNRGRCAQPCRMEYTLRGEKSGETKGHLLSPKDMCTIEYFGFGNVICKYF